MRYLSEEERAEFDVMVAEAHGNPDNGGKATKLMAAKLRSKLLDAEQAGRAWASHVLDDATDDGLHAILKKALKRKSVVLVSHDGQMIGKATRVGVRRDRDGVKHWQQALIHDLTWEELAEWLEMITSQIGSLLVNQAMAKRLLALRSRFPESSGPAEACVLAGTTLDDYLAVAS